MERRRQEEQEADYHSIRRGWCLGSEEFRKELLASAADQVGANHYGADRQESGEQKAERIVVEMLDRLGWTERDLQRRRKGDKGKVTTARRLRKETTMSLKWIAQPRKGSGQMGSWTYVSNLLSERSERRTCASSGG